MEERTRKTLEECKRLELRLSDAEKEKKNMEKKYTQVIFNPLRSDSDQRQISLRNINAFSVREVMRIYDMITQHEFRHCYK